MTETKEEMLKRKQEIEPHLLAVIKTKREVEAEMEVADLNDIEVSEEFHAQITSRDFLIQDLYRDYTYYCRHLGIEDPASEFETFANKTLEVDNEQGEEKDAL